VCQRPKQPLSLNQLIQPTWPLQRWGIDLLGPLPPAQGNLKYIAVEVEYVSKWIEAKPLATITSSTVQKFFWKNIVCCFGVLKAITVDNRTQFDAETFKAFCNCNTLVLPRVLLSAILKIITTCEPNWEKTPKI
jgi:hypothetical protein